MVLTARYLGNFTQPQYASKMGLACGGKKACCQAGAGHAIRQQFGPVARIDADPKGRGLHKRGAGECQRLFPDVADGPGLFHMAGRMMVELHTPLRSYSQGMSSRLSFWVAVGIPCDN